MLISCSILTLAFLIRYKRYSDPFTKVRPVTRCNPYGSSPTPLPPTISALSLVGNLSAKNSTLYIVVFVYSFWSGKFDSLRIPRFWTSIPPPAGSTPEGFGASLVMAPSTIKVPREYESRFGQAGLCCMVSDTSPTRCRNWWTKLTIGRLKLI